MLWDREELELVVRNSPFFSKGDKGGFSEHLDGMVACRMNELDCDTVSSGIEILKAEYKLLHF